jgi:hypothetical protein
MPDIEKAQIFEKMCEAALKEKFSRLSRKYDPDLILKIWAKDRQNKGLRMYFGKLEWWEDKTIGQVLDRLDDYFSCLEEVIRENARPPKKKPHRHPRTPKSHPQQRPAPGDSVSPP